MREGFLKWNVSEISKALKISENDVRNYFTDGRKVSFLLERRIAYEFLNGTLAPSEGAGYDVIDPQGGKWEVRSISKGGIYFCPSYMVGSGRSFHVEGFLQKLSEIEGYIISDITHFPNIPFWEISKDTVQEWWEKRLLGNNTKITREKALRLIKLIK